MDEASHDLLLYASAAASSGAGKQVSAAASSDAGMQASADASSDAGKRAAAAAPSDVGKQAATAASSGVGKRAAADVTPACCSADLAAGQDTDILFYPEQLLLQKGSRSEKLLK